MYICIYVSTVSDQQRSTRDTGPYVNFVEEFLKRERERERDFIILVKERNISRKEI